MEKEPEVFKPVKGYEGYYEISNWGRVKSLARTWSVGIKKDTFLKHGHKRVKNKYLNVTFCVDKVKEVRTVHRLVAEYFCENPNGYNVVNHLDSNIFNNYYKNLEWTTYTGNAIHGFNVGTRKGRKGVEHHGCKISENEVIKIKKLWLEGNKSQRKIASEFNIRQQQVSKIVTGKRWKHI